MSILIKGMEMPDKCGHCRFATAFECEVTKNFITTFNIRQQDCPLAPVPPHGRLIDADKLGFDMMDAVNVDQALAMVDEAPTIIEAEKGE